MVAFSTQAPEVGRAGSNPPGIMQPRHMPIKSTYLAMQQIRIEETNEEADDGNHYTGTAT